MLNKRATQEAGSGELAMVRLADRLATLAPPLALELSRMQAVSMPRPSPAVTTALNTSAAIAAHAAEGGLARFLTTPAPPPPLAPQSAHAARAPSSA